MQHRLLRPVGVLIAVIILSSLAYGFTAQNTFSEESSAGIGGAAVSGYDVTNIRYVLAHPVFTDRVTALALDLDAPANTVHARFLPAGGTGIWKPCQLVTSPGSWYCPGFFENLATIDGLEVVAAQ